jgi:hypothetical protein
MEQSLISPKSAHVRKRDLRERVLSAEVITLLPGSVPRPGIDIANGLIISDFLESLDERSFFNPAPGSSTAANPLLQVQVSNQPITNPTPQLMGPPLVPESPSKPPFPASQPPHAEGQPHHVEHVEVLPAASKTERFLLTAADQEDGTRDERLARVIRAKYEAGLLKPFNFLKGYARLSRWMERKYAVWTRLSYLSRSHAFISRSVSPQSRKQILQPLSILRPKFRVCPSSSTFPLRRTETQPFYRRLRNR